jgi:hypothetical protein
MRGDHHNFKHPASRFIVTIVHPQKTFRWAGERAAGEAIRINLEAYLQAGQQPPEPQSVANHLENPEFRDLLFAYVEVAEPHGKIAA